LGNTAIPLTRQAETADVGDGLAVASIGIFGLPGSGSDAIGQTESEKFMAGKPMKTILRKLLAVGLFGTLGVSASAATTNYGTIAPPFFTFYGDTFQSQTGAFVDDFVFTLSPAGTFDTVAATINLANFFQIDDLQARLYQGSGSFINGTTPLEQGWSTAVSAAPGLSGQLTVINPINLQANTYTLEVQGDVTGTSGGSYLGALSIAALPIPEPGNYSLMLAGLALVGVIMARRRNAL